MSGWPEKPYVIAVILAWLSEQAPVIFAAFLAFSMAVLRVIYGGGIGVERYWKAHSAVV